MKKFRSKVPQETADDVMYKSDRLCPVCGELGHQIHHLDENPSNNDPDNLMLLCFIHHDEATSKKKLSRKLSAGLLRKYRNEHYEKIVLKRKPIVRTIDGQSIPQSDDVAFMAALDAIVCVEVEKINAKLSTKDWKLVENTIYNLNSFPRSIGFRARASILDVLYTLSTNTRHNMPLSVARAINNITLNTLPIRSYSETNIVTVSDSEQQLLRTGVHIGYDVAYDAIKYLQNIKIVDEGIQIMWYVFSYAHINKVTELENHSLEEFNSLMEVANIHHDEYSKQLIEIYRNQGISGRYKFPDFPIDLISRLVAKEKAENTGSKHK
jgi:hypothetical protein